MCSVFVSGHGLKKEVYLRERACIGSWHKERGTLLL